METLDSAEHTLLFISIISGFLGIMQYLLRQRRQRIEAIYARRRQTEILMEINKELHPNDGTTVVDSIRRIEEGMAQHSVAIEELRNTVETILTNMPPQSAPLVHRIRRRIARYY